MFAPLTRECLHSPSSINAPVCVRFRTGRSQASPLVALVQARDAKAECARLPTCVGSGSSRKRRPVIRSIAARLHETAALRELDPAYDCNGSFSSTRHRRNARATSASLRKRRLASKKNPAKRGHPVAGLVQHCAGLHVVIAAQRPITGLDRPTSPKVALALRSSVTTKSAFHRRLRTGQPTFFEGDVRYEPALVHDAARQRQRRALADAVASQCGTMDRPKSSISLSLIVLPSHQSMGGSYES